MQQFRGLFDISEYINPRRLGALSQREKSDHMFACVCEGGRTDMPLTKNAEYIHHNFFIVETRLLN